MICHRCESEDVTLTVMNSPIIIDQVEVLAVCQDCGAEHEHSISGGDFELIEEAEKGIHMDRQDGQVEGKANEIFD